MKAKTILLAALMAIATAVSAQLNDNEWEVNQAPRDPNPYVEGEVIVKFKATSAVRVRGVVRGTTTGVTAVDQVYARLGVTGVEELMPLTGGHVSTAVKKVNGRRLAPDQNLSKLALVRFSAADITAEEAAARLEQLPQVEYAEPNYKVYIQTIGGGNENIPTADSATYCAEPLYSQQWGPAAINLPWLWNQTKTTSRRPVIAIIDTGVDIAHPDLAANIWTNTAEMNGASGQDDDQNGYFDDIHGYDFVNNSYTMQDRNGHGTHCAGIAAAVGDNGIGITGANPDAYIMPVKVMADNGTGDIATIIKGIDYAVDNGADVLSMSFGSCSNSAAEKEALLKAYYADKVLVAAAGNNGQSIYQTSCLGASGISFPAAYSFVIGVEATNPDGSRAGFSNYDPDGPIYTEFSLDEMFNYEAAAPGANIYSTFPNGSYKSLNGTSMACPLVAGAISRMMQCGEFSSLEMLSASLSYSRADNYSSAVEMKAATLLDESSVQPVLAVVGYEMTDTIEGGNADGDVDAGETIAIYPTVKCLIGFTDSVYLRLEVADISDRGLVELIDSVVPLAASLSCGASRKSRTPLVFRVSEQCGSGYPLKLRCVAVCANSSDDSFSQILSVNVQSVVKLSGLIEEDMVLHAGVNYEITAPLGINEGATLTIMPGAVVRNNGGSLTNFGGNLIARGKPDSLITFLGDALDLQLDTLEYMYFPDWKIYTTPSSGLVIKDCMFMQSLHGSSYGRFAVVEQCNLLTCPVIHDSELRSVGASDNYVLTTYADLYDCNIPSKAEDIYNGGHNLNIRNEVLSHFTNCNFELPSLYVVNSSTPVTVYFDSVNYYHTAKESILRSVTLDRLSGYNWAMVDFSKMKTAPSRNAHAMVWKVLVDGYDTFDDADIMPDLGVGTHQCDVYFNRPMRTSVTPVISYGVREPYTQNPIVGGSWSADSTIYTAYFTIDGKAKNDGQNYIIVSGAKDDDGFTMVEENVVRYQMNISAVGSLATGLIAEAGFGKITLLWNTDEEDYDDLLGYDLYRWTTDTIKWDSHYGYREDGTYGVIEAGWRIDTIQINQSLIDSRDSMYVDCDVVPGKQYFYLIKQLTTSFEHYNISNPVTAVPYTAIKGDANGSMAVDVADVITEVNYISRQNPQPFIFDAADVNSDGNINIFDVIGTINIILHPEAQTAAINEGTAYYYVENGILYVESDAVMAGLQFSFSADSAQADIRPLDALTGFEQVAQWMNDKEYFFMAYSMTGRTIGVGKTALLQIGDAEIKDIALSDAQGHNIACTPMVSTALDGTRYMPNTEKFIRNGHLYIRMGEKIYTATGALVE